MLLVPRDIFFDVMRRKKDIKLNETDSSSLSFKNLCSRATTEFKENKDMKIYANAMLRYLNDNKDAIRYVGQGSSRMVFAMADGTAIKLAKTPAGIAQNWQEAKNCMDPNVRYEIFPDFYAVDRENWLALNCELCTRAKEQDFAHLLRTQPRIIADVIEFVFKTLGQRSLSLDQKLEKAYEHYTRMYEQYVDMAYTIQRRIIGNVIEQKTEAFKALRSLFEFYMTHSLDDLLLGDLESVDNWGIAERNGEQILVIIDAGFSEEIYQSFYINRFT